MVAVWALAACDDGEKKTTGNPPAAPTTLTAVAVSPTEVELAWIDNADNETGYQIERAEEWGPFAEVATVGADITTWDDTTTAPRVNYSYRVRATNDVGDSDYSNVATTRIEFLNFANFQPAMRVIGQSDFVSNLVHQGDETPLATTVYAPYGNPVVHNGVLYVPDYSDNRLMGFNAIPFQAQ